MNLSAELSKRELEVAKVMAFTRSKSEAADKLCISEGTLSAHTYRIYEKLEIHSKSELVIWWMVTKLRIEKALIPYFQLMIITMLSIGMMQEDHFRINSRPGRRTEIKSIQNTTK